MVENIEKLISIVNDSFGENQIYVCFTIWFMYSLYFYEFSQLHFLDGEFFFLILKKNLEKIKFQCKMCLFSPKNATFIESKHWQEGHYDNYQ